MLFGKPTLFLFTLALSFFTSHVDANSETEAETSGNPLVTSERRPMLWDRNEPGDLPKTPLQLEAGARSTETPSPSPFPSVTPSPPKLEIPNDH